MYDTFGSLLHGYYGLAYANQHSRTVTDGNTIRHTYRVAYSWRDSHSDGYVYTDTDTH
jgi:hypothetical protein